MGTIIVTNRASGRTYSVPAPRVPATHQDEVYAALATLSGSRWTFGVQIAGLLNPRHGSATRVWEYKGGPALLAKILAG